MKYIIQNWDKQYDGILYFVQRLQEMLFHYSDDIVKAPVHNTVTLIYEYVELENDTEIMQFHFDAIANELIASLQKDVVLKSKWSPSFISKLITTLKVNQKETVHYLHGLISFREYYESCQSYVLSVIDKSQNKSEIGAGLRCWIASTIWAGYTPEYVYRFLRNSFNIDIDNPKESIEQFINHFQLNENEYDVYFLFMGSISQYKELLTNRLTVFFEEDPYFNKLKKKDNKAFVGKLKVKAIDPYVAMQMAYENLNIFVSFYRVISNRKKELLGKNCFVRNCETNEKMTIPTISTGFKNIEIEPKLDLQETIDHAVIGCQSKPQDIYFALNKIIALHNMALRQRDMNDAFVNLWSVLEVVSKDTEINSKIERVIKSVLPILQNDFFNKYFVSILRDIEHSLTKGEIKQMFSGLEDEDMQQDILYELICLITQPEYEKNRDELFKKLTLYPNIRNKIYKVYKLREHKDQVFDLSVQYAQRLKWHLYRLYRVRNGIVHAGDKSRHIQVLGEHLHIYCDGIIMELISKLASEVSFVTIQDVLVDTKLLISSKEDWFKDNGEFSRKDISYLIESSFKNLSDKSKSL